MFGRSVAMDCLTYSASISVCNISVSYIWFRGFTGRDNCLHTFSHEICPPDAILDLFLVAQAGVGHEGLVQAGSEELVARGVLAAEVEEFCLLHARSGLCSSYFVQGV